MPEPITIALIVVFVIHFIAFFYLYLKRGRAHLLCMAGAFGWLILYQIIRLWWFNAMLFGYSVQSYFRLAAWITTGLGVILFIRFKLDSIKNHTH